MRQLRHRIDTGKEARHLPPMVSARPQPTSGKQLPVFAVACWAMALMAFLQLLVAGMALATRFKQSQQIRVVERVVERVVPPTLIAQTPAPAVVSHPPVAPMPAPVAPMPAPVAPAPVTIPQIASPRAERLVNEARAARVAGDMGRAIVKLEEAQKQAPEDPSVQYELGLVHEQMGVFDRASAHYEKVFQLGVSGAGALYEKAATKLRDGFAQPTDMLGKLSLGQVRIFNNPHHDGGQRVILTIPVQKSPAEEVDVAELAVSVIFFNRTAKGEIIQLEEKSWVTEQWITLPFDWANGEESLRMTYTIPAQDLQTEHLFGGRTYYGQVVSLLYKDEVLDVQAWPRDLAARIPNKTTTAAPGDNRLPEFQDKLPADFDPTVPLLPALPAK